MIILITGICGYVGSRFAQRFAEALPDIELVGLDNLSRRGSESHLAQLKRLGATVHHGDIRQPSDLAALPDVDWVVDCAANPTVLAGTAGSGTSPRQLVEHNLVGTLNVLEYCRERSAGLVLLSTSRVYSITALTQIPLVEGETRLEIDDSGPLPAGLSSAGIGEAFSTDAPLSLYGATKRASEVMALEYATAYDLPVWINRCGVIGGPGQLGRIDQGIFSFWVYSCALERSLRYIGFNGSGKQVRDCVLAEDVADLVLRQMANPGQKAPSIANVGGGMPGALSLRELTALCAGHLDRQIDVIASTDERPYDIPLYVSDTSAVTANWNWRPSATAPEIVASLCRWTLDNLPFVRSLFA